MKNTLINKSQKNRTNSLIKFGLVAIVVALLISASHLLIKVYKTDKLIVNEKANRNQDNVAISTLYWETYVNEAYRYSIKYPNLLYKREYVNQGGYGHFVRFEETRYSADIGIGIGVSVSSLEDETARIKEQLAKEGANLTRESEMVVLDNAAKKLVFDPLEEGGAGRVVVVVSRDTLTFSFSTTPEYMSVYLSTLKFYSNFAKAVESDSTDEAKQ